LHWAFRTGHGCVDPRPWNMDISIASHLYTPPTIDSRRSVPTLKHSQARTVDAMNVVYIQAGLLGGGERRDPTRGCGSGPFVLWKVVGGGHPCMRPVRFSRSITGYSHG